MLRHMRVFPRYRVLCRSVVRGGIVHVSVTFSPFLAARKSVGGFGNSSEGASGGPIDAHPAISATKPSSNSPRRIFMQRQQSTSDLRGSITARVERTLLSAAF